MARQIRLKGRSVGKESESKLAIRSATVLLRNSVSSLDMSDKEIKNLIDFYVSSDREMKAIAVELTAAKIKILEHCQDNKWDQMEAPTGTAIAKSSVAYSYGDATALAKLLKKMGKLKIFNTLVGPKVTECKKYLGEETLKEEKFMTVGKTVKRAAVTIKKK